MVSAPFLILHATSGPVTITVTEAVIITVCVWIVIAVVYHIVWQKPPRK